MSDEEQYNQILQQLCEEVSHVKAIALAETKKCCMLSQILPPASDPEVVCSVISPTIALMGNYVREFGHDEVRQICIKGTQGFIVLQPVAEQLVLMIFTSHKVQLNLLSEKLQKARRQLTRIIEKERSN